MRVMSWPSSTTRPSEAGTSRMIALPRVDLPQPDSPTRPSVSPASTSKLTSSTARTTPRALWYWTQRLSTESSGIARQLLFGSETGCGTMRKQRPKDRPFGPAAIEHFRATILERAANRQFGEASHAACDFREAAPAPAQRRMRPARPPQQLERGVHGLPVRYIGVAPDRLNQLSAGGRDRIERGHRIVENHRDLSAPHPLHLAFR